MIKNTLLNTKKSTFAIVAESGGIFHPFGTGFLISSDGWFVTAAHVLFDLQTRKPQFNHGSIILMRDAFDEQRAGNSTCCYGAVHEVVFEQDFALLKIDEKELENSKWLEDGKMNHLIVSEQSLQEADDVYSYGYPLSQGILVASGSTIDIHTINPDGKKFSINTSVQSLCPRITSAIVSSIVEHSIKPACDCPDTYILDKALNYGNSGGPIISSETGFVHAFCSSFQPVFIPQNHITGATIPNVMIPSLYGVVKSLGVKSVIDILKGHGIAYHSK